MQKSKSGEESVNLYIGSFPIQTHKLLHEIRSIIRNTVPEAQECISYGIPTYKLNGNLVHFGGFKTHIGFYPGAEAIKVFADKIKSFKSSKGAVQFPINATLPHQLIIEIILFRKEQQINKKIRKHG